MQLTDTHIHLFAEEYDPDRASLINDARNKGVSRFLLPNIDENSICGMLELCHAFPENCFPMIGLHPCYVNENYQSQLEVIRKALDENRNHVVGIGEIGLDYYWDLKFKKEQEAALRTQLTWAHELKLAVSIHSRNATSEIISIIREMALPGSTGVFHCFSGDINQADEILNLGYYFGIGGVVTFKNSELASIVADLPLDRIVLETDGPYLAPTPFRGKRNLPSYLNLIAEKIAEIKDVPLEQIAEITSANAAKIFRLKQKV